MTDALLGQLRRCAVTTSARTNTSGATAPTGGSVQEEPEPTATFSDRPDLCPPRRPTSDEEACSSLGSTRTGCTHRRGHRPRCGATRDLPVRADRRQRAFLARSSLVSLVVVRRCLSIESAADSARVSEVLPIRRLVVEEVADTKMSDSSVEDTQVSSPGTRRRWRCGRSRLVAP